MTANSDFITVVDVSKPESEDKRESTLQIRKDAAALRVVGVLPHSYEFEPKSVDHADKLIRWLHHWKRQQKKVPTYKIDFSEEQRDEIASLVNMFDLEHCVKMDEMSRMHWLTVAYLALGKAQCIDEGRYSMGDDDDTDLDDWANELRQIANIILDRLMPGDGNI